MKVKTLIEGNVFQVKHDGPDEKNVTDDNKHLFGKKDTINHTTKYQDSAIKTKDMLVKKGYKNVRVYKNVKLHESRMSELHQSCQDHLDKHIAKFNAKKLGHDQFGEHCIKAAHKIAKEHGIEHKDAQKVVNDYVDSKLN